MGNPLPPNVAISSTGIRYCRRRTGIWPPELLDLPVFGYLSAAPRMAPSSWGLSPKFRCPSNRGNSKRGLVGVGSPTRQSCHYPLASRVIRGGSRWRAGQNTFRLVSIPLVRSLIDVTSMADGNNHDQQHSIIDGVDDSVVPNPQPVTLSTSQRPRRRRARILGEQRNCPLNPGLRRSINLAKFAKGCRSKFDAVLVHDQPRSLFTCSQGMLAPASVIAASKATTSSDSSNASSIWSYCSGLTRTAARRP